MKTAREDQMGDKRNSKFKAGSGVYSCDICGKQTRETGHGESSCGLCVYCYEVGGAENSHTDGWITRNEFERQVAELRVKHHHLGHIDDPLPVWTAFPQAQEAQVLLAQDSVTVTVTVSGGLVLKTFSGTTHRNAVARIGGLVYAVNAAGATEATWSFTVGDTTQGFTDRKQFCTELFRILKK
jgi:hypothetical protein